MKEITWNPIGTVPTGEPVLVTDEEDVYFGRIERYADFTDKLFFSGVTVELGGPYSCFCTDLTGWRPALKTMWEPKEETFREKTERIISELSGMMGKKMSYGEMVGAPAQYCGCGPMVYENPEDYSLEKAADILQRMLNNDWELTQETAEEMFRELEYTKSDDDSVFVQYTKADPVSGAKTVIEAHPMSFSESRATVRSNHRPCWFTLSEAKAIVRLLEELEVSEHE